MEIFSKPVKIALKSNLSHSDQTITHPGITVKITQLLKETRSKVTLPNKILQVQLTDESDPFFFYQLDINEEDFHVLKHEQTLLVDFTQFPYKFIELLEECISSSKEEHPKFIAQLCQDQPANYGLFSIVETNTFKHINHLTLKFIPGNDFTTKQYLAQVVKDLKKVDLEQRVVNLNSRLAESEKKVGECVSEMEKFKLSSADEINQLKLLHAKELANEKERLLAEKESLRMAFETKESETRLKFERDIRDLSDKLAKLGSDHEHVLMHAQNLERNVSDTTNNVQALKTENLGLKEKLDSVNRTCSSQVSKIKQLEGKIESLTQSLQDAEVAEQKALDAKYKSDEKLKFYQHQIVMKELIQDKEEGELGMVKKENENLMDSLRTAGDEINKANEIIRKLQADLKNARTKLKFKNVVTVQQEQLLEERLANLEQIQKDMQEFKDTCKKQSADIEKYKLEILQNEKTIEDNKKVISDNNHVIEWLHKQLNEDAIHRPGGGFGLKSNIDFGKYAVPAKNDNLMTNYTQEGIKSSPEYLKNRYTTEKTQTTPTFSINDYHSSTVRGTSPLPQSFTTQIPVAQVALQDNTSLNYTRPGTKEYIPQKTSLKSTYF